MKRVQSNPFSLRLAFFFVGSRSRGVDDIEFTLEVAAEAAAGARVADQHLDIVALRLGEAKLGRAADAEDGARSVDDDGIGFVA